MPARNSRITNLPSGPYLEARGHHLSSPEGQTVLEHYKARMATWPGAGNTPASVSRHWYDRDTALTMRYVQPNHPNLLGILTLDLDQQNAETSLIYGRLAGHLLPAPNLETWRHGGRWQAVWLLDKPVGTSATHRQRPQLYLNSVRIRLCMAFEADPHCTGLVMRGLMHSEQTTLAFHDHLWRLDELDAMLPPLQVVPDRPILPVSAQNGRNCAVFRGLEHFACGLLKTGLQPMDPQFEELLRAEGYRLMTQLPAGTHPYTRAEMEKSIRSVKKRAEAGKCRPAYSSRSRAEQWSLFRPPLTPEESRERQMEPLQQANQQRAEERDVFYRSAARRLIARGSALTEANMAEETGRNERTVRQHAPTWRAVQSETCSADEKA